MNTTDMERRIAFLEEAVVRISDSLREWQRAVYETNDEAQTINNKFVSDTERVVVGFASAMESRIEALEEWAKGRAR